jgi:hypothetical protein
VTFSINRHASGRVVGGSCRRATHKKSQGAKKCTLGQVADVFTKLLPVGASSFAFSGRYKSSGKVSSLKPGRYSLYATATDAAGNIGPQSGLSFQIVK